MTLNRAPALSWKKIEVKLQLIVMKRRTQPCVGSMHTYEMHCKLEQCGKNMGLSMPRFPRFKTDGTVLEGSSLPSLHKITVEGNKVKKEGH
jgi:hypothetical protein